MANRNFTNNKIYNFEVMPVLLSCNFVVDSTNGNGFGARSLKGEGIARAYLHTTVSPAPGNPNPAPGLIMIQFTDCYARYLSGFSGQVSPVTSSSTSTTTSVINVITVLGTASLAQWQAVGLPKGVTPAIGAAFIASSSSLIGGSAQVALAATAGSGIGSIEVVGDPNLTIISQVALPTNQVQPIGQTVGGYILLRCMQNGAQATPADGSVIGLNFLLSNSSNTVKGQ